MGTIGEIGDKLRECINHAYRDEYEDMQKFGSNVKHLDEAMSLLNELVEGSKAGHWISVSEGSPKESGKYLVTFGGTYLIGEDFYSTEEDAKEIFEEPEEDIGWRSHNVIAWTQLPKPYKLESEDKE